MDIRRFLKKFSFFGSIYRFVKKRRSHLNYFVADKIQKKVLDKEYFLKKFPEIGLNPGDHIIINSSLSAMGSVKDGPQTLIDSLKEYITRDGLIVMSTYPHTNMFQFLESNEIFDVQNTPSKNGLITEIFRKNENVFRSLHPTHSLAAWGKNAAYFMNGHELSLSPYDLQSPYKKLLDINVKILLIGVNFNHAVMIRIIDDLYEDYQLSPYIPDKVYKVKVRDCKGNLITVQTPCHDPKFSKERNNMVVFPYIKDKVIFSKLGDARTWVLNSHDLYNKQVELSKAGIFPFFKLPLKNRN